MADIGVFLNLPSTDAEALRRKQILEGGLPGLTFDYRHGGGDYSSYGSIATDLVKSNPDARVFVASCWPTMQALNNVTPTGIVYAGLTDSPDSWYSNNETGIKSFDPPELCPNWPYLLTQIAPNVKNVAVIYDQDPSHPCMRGQYDAITTSSSSLGLPLVFTGIDARLEVLQLESAIDEFAKAAGAAAGLIVTSGTLTAGSRLNIIGSVARNKLPAIYPNSLYTDSGKCPEAAGLISYGPNLSDLYQRAVSQFLAPILQASVTTTNIRTEFQPVASTGADFNLVVSQSVAGALSLTVPKSFTVIDANGQRRQVIPTLVS